MDNLPQKPICVRIPGIEIYLTTYFFKGVTDRPPRMHTHPCYEIVCTGRENRIVFTLIPPLCEHYSKTVADGRICSFLFSFTEEAKKDMCRVISTVENVTEITDTFDGISRIRAIQNSGNQNDFGWYELLKAQFRLFFVQLAQIFYTQGHSKDSESQTLDNERIALLENFFNIEMRDPNCCKQQLAKKIGVCERQLTRILKKTYNSSFSAILMQSRMNMAQAMLVSGEGTIEKIAHSVGYTSVASFRTAYKKFFGHLPRKK